MTRTPSAKPRLRFDKGALRFIADLRAALRDDVPAGKALVLTVTAPIRLRSRTASAFESKIRLALNKRGALVAIAATINGNRVCARAVRTGTGAPSEVIGFVHNPGTSAEALVDVARRLLTSIYKKGRGKRSAGGRDKGVIVADRDGSAYVEAYRWAYAQLRAPSRLARVSLSFDGRIEALKDRDVVGRAKLGS